MERGLKNTTVRNVNEMEDTTMTDGSVAAPVQIGSGATSCNRMTPCVPAPVLGAPVPGETTIILHTEEKGELVKSPRTHTTCNPFVYEAMRLLEEHGYEPSRPVVKKLPVAIVALKGREVLKIAVIRSRKPVPDARTLRKIYPQKFDQLCSFPRPGQYKTMVWVNSPLIGWRYYLVETGGIRRDWDFTNMMEQ